MKFCAQRWRRMTGRTDAKLFANVDELKWRGPTDRFAAFTARMADERLLARSLKTPAS